MKGFSGKCAFCTKKDAPRESGTFCESGMLQAEPIDNRKQVGDQGNVPVVEHGILRRVDAIHVETDERRFRLFQCGDGDVFFEIHLVGRIDRGR